ncbi:LmbE-like protein [Pluteus cervinus]|uniref:LmbE-like protein n=1 Tax=Pluteus cervinus TaxID=181527 RepID=A0ACD3AP75_9AGAR|nr:LmbE-like protein [Pluteus cervinus]
MFFAPTVLALTQDYNGRLQKEKEDSAEEATEARSRRDLPLFSLCMSTGNADGLGETRRDELKKSLQILGITKSWAVDHPKLQDNFTATWDPAVIAEVLEPYIVDNNITIILTFDNGGVSGHPNHISLPLGVKQLVKTTSSHPRLYTLVTVPLLPKYSSIFGSILTALRVRRLSSSLRHFLQIQARFIFWLFGFTYTFDPSPQFSGASVVFVSNVASFQQALRAMREHWSQLVWFRWLYVTFSRYMWVNEWLELV